MEHKEDNYYFEHVKWKSGILYVLLAGDGKLVRSDGAKSIF